ncbi:MAG: hypothetical protein IJ191_03620 [Treponema sp.]|nr:hypothetical protein [Treponema sp.]
MLMQTVYASCVRAASPTAKNNRVRVGALPLLLAKITKTNDTFFGEQAIGRTALAGFRLSPPFFRARVALASERLRRPSTAGSVAAYIACRHAERLRMSVRSIPFYACAALLEKPRGAATCVAAPRGRYFSSVKNDL